jgi:hypothetical protein
MNTEDIEVIHCAKTGATSGMSAVPCMIMRSHEKRNREKKKRKCRIRKERIM